MERVEVREFVVEPSQVSALIQQARMYYLETQCEYFHTIKKRAIQIVSAGVLAASLSAGILIQLKRNSDYRLIIVGSAVSMLAAYVILRTKLRHAKQRADTRENILRCAEVLLDGECKNAREELRAQSAFFEAFMPKMEEFGFRSEEIEAHQRWADIIRIRTPLLDHANRSRKERILRAVRQQLAHLEVKS